MLLRQSTSECPNLSSFQTSKQSTLRAAASALVDLVLVAGHRTPDHVLIDADDWPSLSFSVFTELSKLKLCAEKFKNENQVSENTSENEVLEGTNNFPLFSLAEGRQPGGQV